MALPRRRLVARHINRPNRVRIYLRFVLFLLWEFRWPLGVFALLIYGGGLLLHLGSLAQPVGYSKAVYSVFLMIFLESSLEFPEEWYLQPLFFLVPLIGLGALADSVVRLAYLMFTQKQRLPEWQHMVASLYRDHVVVVGVGKVGYRVIQGLVQLHEAVVAVDSAEKTPLLDEIYDLGVPVIQGSGRNVKTLKDAGVPEARAVILVTSDDLTNLDAGLTARDLNPGARIVVRLFDETLAEKISGAFAMPAISTAKVSAPAFVAAATGRKVYQPLQLSGQSVQLTDIVIREAGGLVGMTVGTIQADHQVNIVMHQGPNGVNVNPQHSVTLAGGDTILVIAPMERLVKLEQSNLATYAPVDGPIFRPGSSEAERPGPSTSG